MSLIFNGTTIEKVIFNGTEIEKLIYNGTTVFESSYVIYDNGTIKKAKQSDFDFYKKQLYIYCLGIEKIYGRRPNKIGWNFIRSGQIHLLDFDEQEYKEACEWAKETIGNVYCTERFSRVENFFYCNNLCKYRNLCYRLGEEDEY